MEIGFEELKSKTRLGNTDIYAGSGITANVAPTVKTIFESGLLCLVYEEQFIAYANILLEEFKVNGFKAMLCPSDDSSVAPEFVRYVFAVGGNAASRSASVLAEKLNLDWSMLLTTPDCEEVFYNKNPNQLFIDEKILINCQIEQIASAWGIVLSEPICRFERYFAGKVLAEDPSHLNLEFKNKDLPSNASLLDLTLKVLEISLNKTKEDSAEIMAKLLKSMIEKKGGKSRLIGEYKFICSSLLQVFYINFLGSPSIDVLPPRSHDEFHESIVALTSLSRENVIKRFDFFDINSYFKISYTLGEYRTDLLERLSGFELHSTQRFWRRLYKDAGYWLKGALTSCMLLNALACAGEFSGGLLGYAAATGFCDSFIKKTA